MRQILAIGLLAMAVIATAQDETAEERQVRFADGLLKRGFYAEAADEYKKYLADFPEGTHRSDASYRLGESLFGAKDIEFAAEAFSAFINAYPDHPDRAQAQLRTAECMYRLGRGSEAVPRLRELSTNPDTAIQSDATYYLGSILAEEGSFEKAAEVLTRFNGELADARHAPFGRYKLAQVLEDLELFDEAADMYTRASTSLEGPLQSDSAMNAGRIYLSMGQPERAAALYANLAQLEDATLAEEAGARLPWAWIEAGEYTKANTAVADFRKRFENARAGEMALAAGRAAEGLEQVDAARSAYAKAAASDQDEFAGRAHYRLAKLEYTLGEFETAQGSALAAIERLAGNTPWLAASHLLVGDIKRSLQDVDGARGAYERVGSEYGQTASAPTALYRLGEMAIGNAQIEEGAAYLDSLVEAHPDSPLAPQARITAADAVFNGAQFSDAAKRYELLASSLSEDATDDERKSIVLRCAAAHYNAGNSDSATKWYKQFLSTFPKADNIGEVRVRLGEMLVEFDPNAAIEQFRAALETDAPAPWPGRARAGLGLALYEQESYDESAKVLRDVVANHSKVALSPTAYAWLGQRLFDAKDFAGAANVFEAMIAAHPEDPRRGTAMLLLGRSYDAEGKQAEAITAFTRAVDSGLVSSEARYRLAIAHERGKELDKALPFFEAGAQEEGSWSAASRLGWARILHRQGNHSDAARQYMLIGIVYQDDVLTPLALHGAALCYDAVKDEKKATGVRAELTATYPEFKAPDDPFSIPDVTP